jgi:hypothetical protein
VRWLTPAIQVTWEAETRKTHGSRPAQAKNLQDPISTNKKLGAVMCAPVIYMVSINRRMTVQVRQSIKKKSKTLLKKIMKIKRFGSVAQVHLSA